MKRSKPLRRTGFKAGRPVHVARDDGLVDVVGGAVKVALRPLRAGTYARPLQAIVAQPKRQYVRSRKLLNLVGKLGICSLWCLGMRRPVCACHSNWGVHGKGKGKKADDNRIAAGCRECHHELDQGTQFNESEKQAAWWRGHVATVDGLLEAGLWPDGVPVPDTAHNPFA